MNDTPANVHRAADLLEQAKWASSQDEKRRLMAEAYALLAPVMAGIESVLNPDIDQLGASFRKAMPPVNDDGASTVARNMRRLMKRGK